jgi:hypothetical protein
LTGNVPLVFLAEDAQLRAYETVVMAQRDVIVVANTDDDGGGGGGGGDDGGEYDERREYNLAPSGRGGGYKPIKNTLSFRRGQYIIAEMDDNREEEEEEEGGGGGGGRGGRRRRRDTTTKTTTTTTGAEEEYSLAYGRLPDGSRGLFEKAAVVSVGA